MPSRPSRKTASNSSSLRIIGGEWRGRRLQFPEIEGLRPTPDRVRETLFNWLMPVIAGARCLDLFAGSGALGLEALSRGAASVTFVDLSRQVKQSIEANLALLKTNRARVYASDALSWTQQAPAEQFDILFLDPPFRKQMLTACCETLEARGMLAPGAYIYIEAEEELTRLIVPGTWRLHRHQRAGQVQYALFIRDANATAPKPETTQA